MILFMTVVGLFSTLFYCWILISQLCSQRVCF